MASSRKPVTWLAERDIMAVDVEPRGIFLRSIADSSSEPNSDTDVPVIRVNKTTFRLNRGRAKERNTPISVYCSTLTINV